MYPLQLPPSARWSTTGQTTLPAFWSCTSHCSVESSRMAVGTEATLFWARSVLPFVSPLAWRGMRAGWLNTCWSWAWLTHKERRSSSRLPFLAPVARPTSPWWRPVCLDGRCWAFQYILFVTCVVAVVVVSMYINVSSYFHSSRDELIWYIFGFV